MRKKVWAGRAKLLPGVTMRGGKRAQNDVRVRKEKEKKVPVLPLMRKCIVCTSSVSEDLGFVASMENHPSWMNVVFDVFGSYSTTQNLIFSV